MITGNATRNLRAIAKARFPFLIPWWRRLLYFRFLGRPRHSVFNEIYRENSWGDEESRSGYGSNLEQTEAVRAALPILLKEYECESLLDIPCGDFYWMSQVELGVRYLGADIVEDLVERNRQLYASEQREFLHLDLVEQPLPRADVVLCRDCLVHLAFSDIFGSLRNIKASGSKYLLTTTFVDRDSNEYIPTGGWRPINLERPPFSFPAPLQ
jgi:hypothetical protein